MIDILHRHAVTSTISAVVLLLVFGYGFVVESFFWSVDSGLGEWFQRSGSILVLVCAGSEFLLKKLTNPVTNTWVKVSGMPVATARPHSKGINLLHFISFTGIILGTFVWGYGDLVIHYEVLESV